MKPNKRLALAKEWVLQEISAINAQVEVLKHCASDFKTLKVAAGLEAPSPKSPERKSTRSEAPKPEVKPVYLQKRMDEGVATASDLPQKRKRLKSSLFDSARSDFVTEPIERETKRCRKKSDYRQTQLQFKATRKE